MKHQTVLIISLVVLALTSSSLAQKPKKVAVVLPGSIHVDLSRERVGRESTKFLAVVGNWSIVADGGRNVLGVDGRSCCGANPREAWQRRRAPSTAPATKSLSTT